MEPGGAPAGKETGAVHGSADNYALSAMVSALLLADVCTDVEPSFPSPARAVCEHEAWLNTSLPLPMPRYGYQAMGYVCGSFQRCFWGERTSGHAESGLKIRFVARELKRTLSDEQMQELVAWDTQCGNERAKREVQTLREALGTLTRGQCRSIDLTSCTAYAVLPSGIHLIERGMFAGLDAKLVDIEDFDATTESELAFRIGNYGR